MMTAGRRRALIAVGVAIAGCTDVNGSADHVAALEFSALPYPAVVAGDTLRDSLGIVAPLRALALNGGGAEIANAQVEFIALDTGLTITPGGLVIARRRSGTVPLIASTATLQTSRVNLLVARSPDSVAISKTARDTIVYDPGVPGSATDITDGLEAKVITKDTAGGVTGTQGWVVSYQISLRNATVAPGDTTVMFLLDDASKRSSRDTTDTGGLAARRLRLGLGYSGPAQDSAIVLATVRHKGAEVRGSPLRFVILLRPK